MNILIVDDNKTKYGAIKRELLSLNIDEGDIYYAEHAASARKLLSEKNFEVMLLDLILPARQYSTEKPEVGLELLRQIVEDNDLPAPKKIIGITADNSALIECDSEFRRLTTQIIFVDLAKSDWKESLGYLIKASKNSSQRQFDFDVCFLSALRHPEQSAILELPYDWQAEELIANGILIRKGQIEINGVIRKAISAHCNQMGMVTSAFITQSLIQTYSPRLLIMNGICGGIDKEVSLGDLIVADKSWDWQSGKWNESGNLESAPDQKDGSSALTALAIAVEKKMDELHTSFKGERPPTPSKIKKGPMVSGSAVIEDAQMHSIFKGQHRKALGVDMECYGLYFSSSMFETPKPETICLKAVSDLANRTKADNIQIYCSYISARVAHEVVLQYFADNK